MADSRAEPDWTVDTDGERLSVAGRIDFHTATALLRTVAPSISDGSVKRVDLAGVTHSNSAGLALMVEWTALARRSGQDLQFQAVPEGLVELARVSQVEPLLELG